MDDKGVSGWRFVDFAACMVPIESLALPAPVDAFFEISGDLAILKP